MTQRNSVVDPPLQRFLRNRGLEMKQHCLNFRFLIRSGVYGPVVVQDDARIEEDGRRSIATQTRTFPLEYVPAAEAIHAITQTTEIFESAGFTRLVIAHFLVYI